jgi:hypothetical protein
MDLDGQLLGTIRVQGDKTSADREKRKDINSLLIGWLLNHFLAQEAQTHEGSDLEEEGAGGEQDLSTEPSH